LAVHLDLLGGVATITIDRPERRNAINLEALEAFDAALTTAIEAEVHCVIVTGAAGHFCAGADLKELEDMAFTVRLGEVLDRLAQLDRPTIAAISGACMGLGMQLAVACDIRFAADGASFGVPVAKLGLMVNEWTLRRVASLVGQGTARLMMLGAEVISTDEAHRLGFIQRVGGLDDARALAERIATLAPLTLAGTKLGLNLVAGDQPSTSMDADYETAFRRAWSSADLAEGRAAFAERRPARFTGR
jgi:enoyl-CoA hydratase